jgi:glycosyltransferase involved in cell wall biosynthesis
MSNRVSYSVVVPVYRSEGTLFSLMQQTDSFFTSYGHTYEIIFVDDASPDNCWQELKRIKAAYPRQSKIFKLAKNAGQQNATLCGMLHATGDYIVTIDDDLQVEPVEIAKLIKKKDETGSDLVYGTYGTKHHHIIRNIGSIIVNKFFKFFSNTYGNGSSFRLINRDITKNMTTVYQKYLLLDEILSWHTDNINHTDVIHHPRRDGKSGYSIPKLIFLTINYIINYTIIPLRLMTYGGMFFSIVTFFFGMYFIYRKYVDYVELGFTSLMVAIFFSTSLILFCLGIIGEYITRLYSKESSRPIYVIKEKHE